MESEKPANALSKTGETASGRRRVLTFVERLRGWISLDTAEQARAERRELVRRRLEVTKRLKRFGLISRPANGVLLPLEDAERLVRWLEACQAEAED